MQQLHPGVEVGGWLHRPPLMTPAKNTSVSQPSQEIQFALAIAKLTSVGGKVVTAVQ